MNDVRGQALDDEAGRIAQLSLPDFRVGRLNAHYEGVYDPREFYWRRICAEDKARNLASLLAAAGNPAVGTVLEVGCGTGAVLLAVKQLGIGREFKGVDMADPNVHADSGVIEAGLAMVSYDGVRLPFADRSFDLVYASHVLEHVPDERSFLAELARVSTGPIYLEVPCELNLRTHAGNLQDTLDIGHINCYTPESFALTLATAGLEVKAIQLFDHSYDIYRHHSGALASWVRMILRRGLLRAGGRLASRVFTYHCGALCVPAH